MERSDIEKIEEVVRKVIHEEFCSDQHARDHEFINEIRPFLMAWMEYVKTSKNTIVKLFWTILLGAIMSLLILGFKVWLWGHGELK